MFPVGTGAPIAALRSLSYNIGVFVFNSQGLGNKKISTRIKL